MPWLVTRYADVAEGNNFFRNKVTEVIQTLPTDGRDEVILNGMIYTIRTRGKSVVLSLENIVPVDTNRTDGEIEKALSQTYLSPLVFEAVMPVLKVITEEHGMVLTSFPVKALQPGSLLIFTAKDNEGHATGVRWFPKKRDAHSFHEGVHSETAVEN